MKTIHIKSVVLPQIYDTLMQAHFGAEQEHETILRELPFDIKKFCGQTVTGFIFGDTFLSMCFHEKQYLNIMLGEDDCLIVTNTDKPIGEKKEISTIRLICPRGTQSIWNPTKLLANYTNKIFNGIHFSRNWIYLYFSDSEFLISVSILHIAEPPMRILYWDESE